MALPSLTYNEFVNTYYPGGGYAADWLRGAYNKYMIRVSGEVPPEPIHVTPTPTTAPTTTTAPGPSGWPGTMPYWQWLEQQGVVSPKPPVTPTPGAPPMGLGGGAALTPLPTVPTTTPTTTVPTEPAVAYPGYGTAPYFEAGEMLTAPISEYEQQALDMLQQLTESLGGMPSPWETPMGEEVFSALESLLSGEFPEEYFRTAIEAPAQKRLEEVTLPGVREAYVGPGTFWGGERAEAERRAGTDVDMMLAAVRGELGYQARQMALETLAPAMEYLGLPAEQALQQMAGVGTFMGAGALPRLIEQHGLDIAYQEFIRTRPENQPYAQMLLSLLGIPMLGAYTPESPESPWPSIASGIGSLLPWLLQM